MRTGKSLLTRPSLCTLLRMRRLVTQPAPMSPNVHFCPRLSVILAREDEGRMRFGDCRAILGRCLPASVNGLTVPQIGGTRVGLLRDSDHRLHGKPTRSMHHAVASVNYEWRWSWSGAFVLVVSEA